MHDRRIRCKVLVIGYWNLIFVCYLVFALRRAQGHRSRAVRADLVEAQEAYYDSKRHSMSFYIYILKCADNSYYTGHTDDLERRLAQHQQRYFPDCYTAARLPVELLFSQEVPTREEALAFERRIKGWSRRKKEAMMRGDWDEVSRLSKSKRDTLRQAQGERMEAVRAEPASKAVDAGPAPLAVGAELVEARRARGNRNNSVGAECEERAVEAVLSNFTVKKP